MSELILGSDHALLLASLWMQALNMGLTLCGFILLWWVTNRPRPL